MTDTQEQDRAAIRALVENYTIFGDAGDEAGFAGLFTEDAVIVTPFNRMEGLANIRTIPAMLGQMFARTLHQVTSQAVTIVGDSASGETKSYANHITVNADGTATNDMWAIRYQDAFRREDGRWKIAARTLLIDWTELKAVKPGNGITG
ncbi:nuclear transport factor 2 family protein [Edaphosphingomonas haloaromaticamans]|uniref:SnoaL-like domain-containing protein n=1 Tax=Edaphosphingomonas haloaromaticamans TaxID=653954 RepID=A0A1S1HHZ8_9SPHN|nr:nuclear transport factor 2 family protein [Sphingomonas haloaromaticamans]OHT21865.1 hypothetical protein BHE75_03877 [Sphingomonas haloaromaticamans]